jgi:N-methylhydantoinase A
MIAFGGGAPLHACRFAEKTGITTIVVPLGAGVGSAIGFLRAPLAFEVTRSMAFELPNFDAARANALLKSMTQEACAAVAPALGKIRPKVSIVADGRYIGQGHEIRIGIPVRTLTKNDGANLMRAFEVAYQAVYNLTIPGQPAELITWSVTASGPASPPPKPQVARKGKPAKALHNAKLFDSRLGKLASAPVYWRFDLAPSQSVHGPAIIAEHETSTIVTSGFTARLDAFGNIIMEKRS